MSNLSRIAEALEKLIEEGGQYDPHDPHDPYRNEQRIADALERIATVLEFRMPWGSNIFPIQNPPYNSSGTGIPHPYTNPTVVCANDGNAIGPTPEPPITQYTPPPVSYPDYSEPTTFSCGGGLNPERGAHWRASKMGNLITMPDRTFKAKQFESPWETKSFKMSGTLDGFIDFAVPDGGTYPLSIDEAKSLISALSEAVLDVQTNCLYDSDVLLEKP